MTRASGAHVRLGVGFEPVYGTPPDYEKFWRMPFASTSLGSEQGLVSEAIFGSGRDATALGQDALVVDGDAVVPLDARFIGVWLKALFGTPVTTGSAAPYTHRFDSGGYTLPSMTVEIAMQDVQRFATYAGVVANTITLEMRRGGVTRGTVGLVAKSESVAAGSLLENPVEMGIVAFPGFRGEVLRNGVRLGNLLAAQLTYSNNLGTLETIRGWGEIDGADPSFATLTGRLEARFSDDALYQQAVDGGTCELRFEWVLGDFELRFIAHEVRLSRPRLPVQGPGGIQASFDWHGIRDVAEGVMASVFLKNDQAVIDIIIDPWAKPYALVTTWSVATMPSGYSLVAIEHARAQDRFVAVSDVSASQDTLYSTDGGFTWLAGSTRASVNPRAGIAFADALGRYVVGRDYTSNKGVLVSTDGQSWIAYAATSSPTAHHNAVAWSPALNSFVLVGDSGALLISTDGMNWTNISHGFGTEDLWAACWSKELGIFVVVGNDGTIYTSSTGTTWTERSIATTSDLYSVCWSAEVGLFVAGSQAGKLWTSPDGITWTQRTPAALASRNMRDVIWVKQLSRFIGVVDGAALQSVCLVSADGINWSTLAMPVAKYWRGVAWDGLHGTLVAVAEQAGPYSNTNQIAVMQCTLV